MIRSSLYCSSWILTLFGGLLQDNQELLYQIWDNFIYVERLEIHIPICLALLNCMKPRILDRNFEETMTAMAGIYNTGNREVFTEKLLEDAKISKRILNEIHDEYLLVQNRLN